MEHDAQWEKVPALGYLVKDVSAPSSPPRDLAVETLTSTGATLIWSAGSRPAEEYRIYRVMENTARPYAFVGAVSGTKNSFELNDLAGDVSYTFVARGYTNGVESVDSSSISFTTPKENGTNYVQVGEVADQTVRPGEDAVFRPQYSRAIRRLPLPCNGRSAALARLRGKMYAPRPARG